METVERIGRTSRNIPSGKTPKSLKTVKRSARIHFVISRSCVRVTPPAPKSIENFGFRCFFAAKTLKKVWGKMWVNCLTHIVTYIDWQSAALPPTASSCPMGTRKCTERVKEYRRGSFCFLSGIFASFFCSHHFRHEAAHFLRGLLLHLPCDVGVGSQGESCVVVTERAGHLLHPLRQFQHGFSCF